MYFYTQKFLEKMYLYIQKFREKYQPKLTFRLSLNDYHKTDDLIDLPLYAVHLIPEIIEKYNKNEVKSGA